MGQGRRAVEGVGVNETFDTPPSRRRDGRAQIRAAAGTRISIDVDRIVPKTALAESSVTSRHRETARHSLGYKRITPGCR